MNATLHLPTTRPVSYQPTHWMSIFAAILITIQGLLGPDQGPEDDFSEPASIQPQNRAAGA